MTSRKNLLTVLVIFTMGYAIVAAFHDTDRSYASVQPTPQPAADTTAELPAPAIAVAAPAQGCVFKTVFEKEAIDSAFIFKTPSKVAYSIDEALAWIAKAQLNNGGFGAGSHSHQGELDPHAVQADPATTAMVAMAILRSGSTLSKGTYANNLKRALEFLLLEVEGSANNEYNITSLTNTQPQVKLGQNIDVVLTSQFFTNLLDYLPAQSALRNRVVKCNSQCLVKIQRAMAGNGSVRGAGWAGVLQSSFAANALETARDKGMEIDEEKLSQALQYQKDNFDVNSNSAKTEDGAGVMLYSLSSTARSSAKEAREAQEIVQKAKAEGKIGKDEPVTVDALKQSGLSESEALRYGTAFQINKAAKVQAQREDVMAGFGSNGGEEFLSYLQTGEGLIMGKDPDWKKWYSNTTGRLVKIQNDDGSWNGHHCITSPVFCTATALLILSVNNDVQTLMAKK